MAQLTREEYALLSDFSYIDLPRDIARTINRGDASLSEIAARLLDKPKLLSEAQLKCVERILDHPELLKLEFVQYENKDAIIGNHGEKDPTAQGEDITGFVAMGFVSPEGNPIAVYRGSEPLGQFNEDSSQDWVDNLKNMLMGKTSTQYAQAEAFYDKLNAKGSAKPIVVGHSKGGNLAAYIASIKGGISAVLFNPMPLHNNYVNKGNLQSSDIQTYVAQNDFISVLLMILPAKDLRYLVELLSDKDWAELLKFGDGSPEAIAKFLTKFLAGWAAQHALAKLHPLFGIIDTIEKSQYITRTINVTKDYDKAFNQFLKDSSTYTYPGKVTIIRNNSNILNALDSHSLDNFLTRIELDLTETNELIMKLQSINNRLARIDSSLDSLLYSITADIDLMNLFQQLANGINTIRADLNIGKSRTVANCIVWLKEVESEFRQLDRSLALKLEAVGSIMPAAPSHYAMQFK